MYTLYFAPAALRMRGQHIAQNACVSGIYGNRVCISWKMSVLPSDSETTTASTSSTDQEEAVPVCLSWSVDDVADWIERLGYKQYRVNA